MNYYTLYDCPLDDPGPFFEAKLSHSLEDYPEGIVIPIDKPYRWTSADVVRKIKFQLSRHFGLKKLKVGHAGTLDPLATGLLIVCVGKATKIAEELQAHEKEYVACVEFGATTASYDLEQPVDCFYPYEHITPEAVASALQGFVGEQEQVPPIFSAKIIGGLRAYEYARAGEPVELRTNVINIFEAELLDYLTCGIGEQYKSPSGDSGSRAGLDCAIARLERRGLGQGPSIEVEHLTPDLSQVKHVHNYHTSGASDGTRPSAVIRIRCSKGTYIRSLARDLGLALDSGAYLTALRRTASGPFHIE